MKSYYIEYEMENMTCLLVDWHGTWMIEMACGIIGKRVSRETLGDGD